MIKSRKKTDGEENCMTCRRLKRDDKTGVMICRIDGAYARDKDSIETIVCDKYMAKHTGRISE